MDLDWRVRNTLQQHRGKKKFVHRRHEHDRFLLCIQGDIKLFCIWERSWTDIGENNAFFFTFLESFLLGNFGKWKMMNLYMDGKVGGFYNDCMEIGGGKTIMWLRRAWGSGYFWKGLMNMSKLPYEYQSSKTETRLAFCYVWCEFCDCVTPLYAERDFGACDLVWLLYYRTKHNTYLPFITRSSLCSRTQQHYRPKISITRHSKQQIPATELINSSLYISLLILVFFALFSKRDCGEIYCEYDLSTLVHNSSIEFQYSKTPGLIRGPTLI